MVVATKGEWISWKPHCPPPFAERGTYEHGYLKTLLVMKVIIFYLLNLLDISNLLGTYEYKKNHYKVKDNRPGKERSQQELMNNFNTTGKLNFIPCFP